MKRREKKRLAEEFGIQYRAGVREKPNMVYLQGLKSIGNTGTLFPGRELSARKVRTCTKAVFRKGGSQPVQK